MTVARLSIATLALVLAPLAALADPPPATFEVVDRGDSVEVVAHNVKAARTAVLPLRARLQIAVSGSPTAKRTVPGDATVKQIEFDSEDAGRVLSIKLNFEYGEVKTLSRFAQAIQVGDDLHVLIPRKIPGEGVVPKLPEPTLPPALAAAVAKIDAALPSLGPRPDPNALRRFGDDKPAAATEAASTAKPDAPADAKPDAKADAKPDPKTAAKLDTKAAKADASLDAKPDAKAVASSEAKPEAKTEAKPEAKTDAKAAKADVGPVLGPKLQPTPDVKNPSAAAPSADEPAASARAAKPGRDGKPLHQALAGDADDVWSKVSMYAAIGIGAVGIGLWLMRRRRGSQFPPHATIDVIAQRSLGARARVVWLSAGPREMIVSVTAQQVRVLGQWRKTDAYPAQAAAHPHSDLRIEPPADDTSAIPREFARGTADFSAPVGKPVSPAVNGILRLRGRTGQMPAVAPPVSDDVATGDVVADEQWAKEILAATTGPRR